MMKQLFRAGLAVTFLVQPMVGSAHEPIDTILHPELSSGAMSTAIITRLKRSLKDPQSIQGLIICRPYRLGLKGGRPHHWATMLSFDMKNGVGGNVGPAIYVAVFKDGVVRRDIKRVKMIANNGLNRLLDRAIAEDMRGCDSISDENVQEVLRAAS